MVSAGFELGSFRIETCILNDHGYRDSDVNNGECCLYVCLAASLAGNSNRVKIYSSQVYKTNSKLELVLDKPKFLEV